MGIQLKNNATSTITTAISASDVGLAVAAATGSLFPTLGTGDYFYATLVSTGGTREIVKVTARVGDTMTIVRAQEGTTAQSFASGSRIEVRVTAASITGAINASTISISGGRTLADLADSIDTNTLVAWYGNSLVEAPYPLPEIPMPALLQTALRAAGKNVTVYNEGQSGETTPDILWRMQQDYAAGLRPKVVIIGPSAVNNFRRIADDPAIYDVAATQADITAMIALWEPTGAYITLVTDTPWKNYVDVNPAYSWTVTKQGYTDALNTWILAGQPNVDQTINFFDPFESPADVLASAYNRGDNLHFNQPGRVLGESIVRPYVSAALGTLSANLDIIGTAGAIDQDVTTNGNPYFNGGLSVGATQGGFALFGAALNVKLAAGERRINLSTRDNTTISRGLFLDGTMPITFQSINGTVGYRLQAQIGITTYGTGTGKLYLGASTGTAIVKTAHITNVGLVVGHDEAYRKLVVSNNGAEGLEFGPGNANGDAAGSVKILSYNRTTAAIIGIDIQGSDILIKDASSVICFRVNAGNVTFPNVVTYVDDSAAAAGGVPSKGVWRRSSDGAMMIRA